jgi:predicted ATPase
MAAAVHDSASDSTATAIPWPWAAWSRLPPLIGRETEMAALRARLLDPAVGLVTLVGPAGCGKTRLARAVAAELRPAFPGGVYLVDLAPLWHAADVLPAIAHALGVPAMANRPASVTVADFLAERRVLLVLDNVEHVLDAAGELAGLIEDAPGVTCLVTSRTALRLYGEHELPLAPLSLPDGAGTLTPESIGQAPAVQLFVRAAQMVRPDFALTEMNAAAVAEICTRLDGLPLALELAAARIKVLTPDALLRRLTDGAGSPFQVLATGSPNMPARHPTLRAAIAWSHALLTPAEQRLFRRLAIFAGGADLPAIEAVCFDRALPDEADLNPLDLLTSLVNQSLLRQTEVDGEPRFEMLATIREFALEQLATSDEAEMLRERHAHALSDRGATRPRVSVAERSGAGLTRREHEVAVLVARGLTNRQIAKALTVAERTAGTHVEHIMAKLGCHTRAQIAAWVAERGMLAFPDADPLRVA